MIISFALQRALAVKPDAGASVAASLTVQSVETVQEALRTYREAVVSQRRGLYVQRFQELCRQRASTRLT